LPVNPKTQKINHPMKTKTAPPTLQEQIVSICSWLPKCLLPVILLVLCLTPAQAFTTIFGTGSGNLDLEAMSTLGLSSGDTVIIKTGSYGGTLKFKNLTGITIVPQTGGVTFTAGVTLGGNINLTFDGTVLSGVTYGYTFTGTTSAAFLASTSTFGDQNITIKGVLASDVGAVASAAGNILTYTGTPATAAFYNLTLDTIKTTGHSVIFNGSWEAPTTYHTIMIGLTMKNIICISDSTTPAMRVFGNSNYNMLADNIVFSGPSVNFGGDEGAFHGDCGGVIRNIVRTGGSWGYCARIWSISLGTSTPSYFYNVIDYGSVDDGTMDNRIDPTLLALTAAIPICGNDMSLYNVTCGDKTDLGGGYITPLLVLGLMSDGASPTPHIYTAHLKNCFAFNNKETNNTSSLLQNNSGNVNALDKSNNVDLHELVPLPPGYLVDLVSFYPCSGSPLLGAGTVLSQTATDIYGRSRGSSYDAGAVQHDNVAPTVAITTPTSGSTYSTTGTTINLAGTASDDVGVTSVTWSNSTGGSGTATGTTSWTANGVAVTAGLNTITVTSHDAFGNVGTDTLTVTVSSGSTVFSQDFSSSTTVSSYVNLTSPSTGQFNAIQEEACGGTFSITSGKLQLVRTGASSIKFASLNRTTNFSGPPTVMQVTVDLGVTANQTQASVLEFDLGNLTTVEYSHTSANVFAKFLIDATGTNTFKFNVHSIQSAAYSANGTTNTINWYVNKSGSTQSYHGPDGSTNTLSSNNVGFWATTGGTIVKLYDNVATNNGASSSLADFSIEWLQVDSGTYTLDNLVINNALP